ncbi:hypothetical protein EMIT07CA2_10272 [Brevibacillus sp. IT-7CA2]|uniref:hypothetical protein n=1 Tax=Brevibacillus sp. IT-7CA2 TaxID=3026436 RepID=UPI0039E0EDD2
MARKIEESPSANTDQEVQANITTESALSDLRAPMMSFFEYEDRHYDFRAANRHSEQLTKQPHPLAGNTQR